MNKNKIKIKICQTFDLWKVAGNMIMIKMIKVPEGFYFSSVHRGQLKVHSMEQRQEGKNLIYSINSMGGGGRFFYSTKKLFYVVPNYMLDKKSN